MTVRDFIPEGGKKPPKPGQDFIPGPGHKLAPRGNRQEQADLAFQRALKAQQSAIQDSWDGAVAQLKKMNVSESVRHISQLPYSSMELYLAVESTYGQRKGVLDAFPPVDPSVAPRYLEIIGKDAAASLSDDKE